jgi:hypothetical protein
MRALTVTGHTDCAWISCLKCFIDIRLVRESHKLA